MRQDESMAVLAKIEALVQQHQHAVLPQSALGKALHYTASQWTKLTRYVQDGRWPIDNNASNAGTGINVGMPRPKLCRLAHLGTDFEGVSRQTNLHDAA